MLLQLCRNIRPGRSISKLRLTEAVYGSRTRLDTDCRFQPGMVKRLAQGILQTDFQCLRGITQAGRFCIEEKRILT